MAIKFKDYTTTKYSGVSIHGNAVQFLLTIKVSGKLYRKTFKANPAHGKADRLKSAYNARETFQKEKEHALSITADADATVGTYWTKVKGTSGWSDDMIKAYDYYFGKHLSDLGKKKVKNLKPADFTNLNVSLNDLAVRTQLKAYEILKPIIALALEDEIIFKSPIKRSHIPKRKQLEEKKIITDAEAKYRLVYEAINEVFKNNPHHRAAFLLGFHGRRAGEALNLRWEDIDFDNMEYIVRGDTSKVNTDMAFKLPADVASALLEIRDIKGKVFNVKRLDRHHDKIRDYTGIQEFSFHWMRNLAVSALASMGAEITHLSAMLGHTDSGTIRKYLSLQRSASTTKMEELSKKLLTQ